MLNVVSCIDRRQWLLKHHQSLLIDRCLWSSVSSPASAVTLLKHVADGFDSSASTNLDDGVGDILAAALPVVDRVSAALSDVEVVLITAAVHKLQFNHRTRFSVQHGTTADTERRLFRQASAVAACTAGDSPCVTLGTLCDAVFHTVAQLSATDDTGRPEGLSMRSGAAGRTVVPTPWEQIACALSNLSVRFAASPTAMRLREVTPDQLLRYTECCLALAIVPQEEVQMESRTTAGQWDDITMQPLPPRMGSGEIEEENSLERIAKQSALAAIRQLRHLISRESSEITSDMCERVIDFSSRAVRRLIGSDGNPSGPGPGIVNAACDDLFLAIARIVMTRLPAMSDFAETVRLVAAVQRWLSQRARRNVLSGEYTPRSTTSNTGAATITVCDPKKNTTLCRPPSLFDNWERSAMWRELTARVQFLLASYLSVPDPAGVTPVGGASLLRARSVLQMVDVFARSRSTAPVDPSSTSAADYGHRVRYLVDAGCRWLCVTLRQPAANVPWRRSNKRRRCDDHGVCSLVGAIHWFHLIANYDAVFKWWSTTTATPTTPTDEGESEGVAQRRRLLATLSARLYADIGDCDMTECFVLLRACTMILWRDPEANVLHLAEAALTRFASLLCDLTSTMLVERSSRPTATTLFAVRRVDVDWMAINALAVRMRHLSELVWPEPSTDAMVRSVADIAGSRDPDMLLTVPSGRDAASSSRTQPPQRAEEEPSVSLAASPPFRLMAQLAGRWRGEQSAESARSAAAPDAAKKTSKSTVQAAFPLVRDDLDNAVNLRRPLGVQLSLTRITEWEDLQA